MGEYTAVLIPGTLMSVGSYARVSEMMVGRQVRVADVEWMVESPACDIGAVAHFVAEKFLHPERRHILVGHSTGGAIAARVALDHPESAAGLVLINSGPNMVGHAAVDGILDRLRGQVGDDDWADMSAKNVAPGSPRKWLDEMIAFCRLVGPAKAISALSSQSELDLVKAGRTSPVPVEVIHGMLDEKRHTVDADRWVEVFPNSKFTMIAGSGHSPHVETPELVAEIIDRLIVSLTGSGAAHADRR